MPGRQSCVVRERTAGPLHWRVRSAGVHGNLQLPMAVTTRKGHAASVRRQSRQRLRSDRRYRRNRFLRYYRQPVRTASAFPRLPRRPAASFFFLMIRRPPRSTRKESSAASDVYKRQLSNSFLPLFNLINCFINLLY